MPSTVRPHPVRGVAARLRHTLLVAISAAALTTCTDEPTAPGRPGLGTVRVLPGFDGYARLVPLTLDNVHVIVVRPPADTVADVRRQFSVANPQLQLNIPVVLIGTSEDLDVTLELLAGTTLLFQGTSTVRVTAGASPTPATVPVQYQGPGSQIASLLISPRDTTVNLGASFPLGAGAIDSQQAPVAQFYVSWSSTAGSVDGAGVVTAPLARDTFFVKATTPTGIADSTRVFVTAPPSTLLKVAGDNQSSLVGSRLPQLLAVQVNGTDGQPVPGVTVTFAAASGGGSVDSATATTDAQGIARTGAILGTTTGAQSFTASAAGVPTVTFSATATGITPIVVTLDGGALHTCEIRGGTLLCWGENSDGQLGDGTTTGRLVPVPVTGSFTSVAAGSTHTCALTAAGAAFCWGDGANGELGDGTSSSRLVPTAVTGGRVFVQILTGQDFSCGLTAGGQAFCWGSNSLGQLGTGGGGNQAAPTAVSGGLTFTQLAAGSSHACGLTPAGAAFCWGLNTDGQLGTGNLAPAPAPVAVTGGLSFTALGAGASWSCGIAANGSGQCWGLNFGIQLTSPQPVAGGFTYTAVTSGGTAHLCGLTAGGWRCGGDNAFGQLGDGSAPTDQAAPVLPSGGFAYTALGTGGNHTCGRTGTGTRCWGDNSAGQLGTGTTTPATTPVPSVGPATSVAVNAGNGQTASAGTAVPVDPSVIVRDAANAPVRGVLVTFAVTAGGGSLANTTVLTDAAGLASGGTWTLGATAGANTVTATVGSAGVAGNPVSFTATGATPSVVTWTGAVSSAWTDPNNWTPAAVPTSTQDVLIPNGPSTMPVLGTTTTIRSLTLQSSGAITMINTITLTVTGDLDNAGNLTSGGGTQTVVLAGTGRTLRSAPIAAPVAVTGSYTLNGATNLSGALSISGGTASLTVGGQALSAGSVSIGSGGSFVMTNAADAVTVSGNFTAGGGDHTGKLSAGFLSIAGNFLQTSGGSPLSFAASGTHVTRMGSGPGSITFQTPGTTASRFQVLQVIPGGAVTLGSRVVTLDFVALTGTLQLAGRTLAVGTSLNVSGAGGLLQMTNPADSVLVNGNAFFDGASSLGQMSAGVLVLGGTFTQRSTVSGDAFHPSGSHKTVFTAPSPTLDFASPGNVPGTSHFEAVEWVGGGTLTLATDVYSHQAFTITGAGATTITTSASRLLRPNGFVAAGPVTVNGVGLWIEMPGGGPLALTNLTFQGYNNGDDQLRVLHPGTGGPFTLANLTFLFVPTTGNYLYADDLNPSDGVPLTLDLTNPTPGTPGGHVTTLNGAVINWPAAAPGLTWTGAVSTSWTTAGNWSPAVAPTATSDVVLPAGLGTYPAIAAPTTVRNITVAAGASLNLGSSLTATGNVDLSGTVTGIGGVTMNGAAVTVRGSFPNVLSIAGTVTMTGRVTALNQTSVSAGNLTLNGNTLATGQFSAGGTGTFTMTNPLDTIHITTGGGTFRGGNSTGKLTAGAIRFSGGGFDSQLGTFGFASTGTALIFDGSANQSAANNVGGITFADVIVNKPAGNFIWAGGAPVNGQFLVLSPTTVTSTQTIQARRIIMPVGSSLTANAVTTNGDSLTVAGSYSVATTFLNGGSVLPVLPYTGLLLNGSAPITAAGNITVGTFLTVDQFANLVLGGHTLTVGSDFALGGGSSLLTMTNALDTLKVAGNANFSGGNLNGRLTSGAIRVTGNLVFGNLGIFTSTGTRLVLEGTGAQLFNNQAAGTSLRDLELTKTGGSVNLGGVFPANLTGQLIAKAGSIATITNGTMSAAGVDVDGLTFDNVPLTIGNGTLTKFSNVAFINFATTATQLTVNNNGAGGPATFTNVNFAVTPTTGRYLSATDVDGATSGILTLNFVTPTPATPGSFVATAGGAVVNWPAVAPAKTWTGAVSTDWNTAGNWSPAVVPTATDTLVIPAQANQPRLAQNVIIKQLTVQAGAVIDLNSFTLFTDGNLAFPAAPGFTGTGALALSGTGATMQGNFGTTSVLVQGAYSLAGRTIIGAVTINGGGALTVAGRTLVATSLNIQNAGLVMGNAQDSVLVSGTATFGGPANTALTAGTLVLAGDLTETGGFPAFDASGGHKTVLNGGALQTMTVFNGGFQDLDVSAAAGGVRIASSALLVRGTFTSTPSGAAPLFRSAGAALALRGPSQVTALSLDTTQVQVFLPSGGAVQLDGLTFSNLQSFVTALEIIHPGLATPITLTNLTFTGSVPSLYLRTSDFDGGPPNTLTIDLVNPTPATDGGRTLAVNGSVINWPAVAPSKTWTGASTSDWHTSGNWSPAGVPTAADDVIIPSTAPNAPVLSANGAVQKLTVSGGVIVNVNGFQLDVNGDLTAPATGSNFISGGGVVRLVGLTGVVGGSLGVAMPMTVAGNYAVVARTVTGTLSVPTGGSLTLGAQTVAAASFSTSGTGTITMANAVDSLLVTGAATFGGGAETGLLTAGTITVGTNFTQTGTTSAASFEASAGHTVVLTGSAPTVSFTNPNAGGGQSHFGQLTWTGTGTLTHGNGIVILGTLTTTATSGITFFGNSPTTRPLQFAQVQASGALTFDQVRVLIVQTGTRNPVGLGNATFTNVSSSGITALTIQHPGISAGSLVLPNLTFSAPPTGGGSYIFAADNNGTDGIPLVVDLTTPNPATDGGFTQVSGATINWPGTAPAVTWNGSVSSDWQVAGNWSSNSVPNAASTVVIPSGTLNSPVLSAFAATGDLTLQAGAVVNVATFTLQVGGNLNVLGGAVINGSAGQVTMAGANKTLAGFLNTNLVINANTTLAGGVPVSGAVTVGATLNFGGFSLGPLGDFATSGAGALLVMQNASDQLSIGGNATFDGASQLGFMTAGMVLISGNFTQLATHSGDSYHPSGNHLTSLGGTNPTISFATPGDIPTTSHFQDLIIASSTGASTLTLASDVYAHGGLGLGNASGTTLSGSNGLLSAGGLFATTGPVVFDNLRFAINAPAGTTLSQTQPITFQNMNPTATQLTITEPGNLGPITLTGMVFSTAPTAGGFYLSATDADGPSPNPLTINMAGATPASTALFQALNGAVVNWPAVAPGIQWTGTVSTDWFNAGNWGGGVVPTGTANAVIPASTPNPPVLSNNANLNDLTMAPGATLDLGGFAMVLTGNLDNGGLISATPGVGGLALVGTGKLLRGSLSEVTIGLSGSYTLNGRFLVGGSTNGDLAINSGGLTLNGHTVEVTGTFATGGVGVVIMQNALDSLIVNGDALFAGGNSTGAMTNGVFRLGGNLGQAGGDPGAFSPQLSHKTLMEAGQVNTPTEVSFANPGSSHFANVEFANPFGVQLGSRVMATTSGTVNVVVSAGEFATAGNTLEIGGNFSTVGSGFLRMPVAGDSVIVSGNATFAGASTEGFLDEGVLVVGNDFTQNAVTDVLSFAPSGNHTTVLGSASIGTHLIDFGSPGPSGVGSHFANLDLSPASTGVTLTVNTIVEGMLTAANQTGVPVLNGGGASLTVRTTAVSALSVDNAPIIINDAYAPSVQFDNVSFSSMDPTVDQLTVVLPGSATPLAFSNLTFSTTPSSGRYLTLLDADGPSPDALTLNMVNPTPGTDGGFVSVQNGAILFWPGTAPGMSWTGATSTDWQTASNWSTNAVPTAASDVTIPTGMGSYPSLTAAAFTRNLSIQTGGSVDLNGFTLTSSGSVDAGTTITGAGTFTMDGTGSLLSGTVPNLRVIAPVTLNGQTTITGSLTIDGAGADLQLANSAASVAGDLTVQNGAVLTMTGGEDLLIVAGNATFNGGDESGRLTAGILEVQGNFVQGGTAAVPAFAGSGSHKVRLTGPTSTVDVVGSNSTTVFATLEVATSGPVALNNLGAGLNMDGTGQLQVLTPVTVTYTNAGAGDLSFAQGTFTVAGSTITGPAVTLVPGSDIQGTWSVTTTTWSQGAAPQMQVPASLPYQNLTVQGTSIFLDPGGWSIPGDFLGRLPNANFLRSRDTLGTPTQLTVGGDLEMFAGILLVDGGKVTVNGDLRTTTTGGNRGRLGMQNAADSVIVLGSASFDGANQTGLLTAGVLRVAGNFTQANTAVPTSFVASGSHRTELNGTGLQLVSFADSTVSGFRDLVIQGSDTVRVDNSMVRVAGNVTVQPGAKLAATDNTFTGDGLNVFGNFSAASTTHLGLGRLYLAGTLGISGPYFITSTIFTGTGQIIPSGVQYRHLYSTGASVTTAVASIAVDSQLAVQAGTLTLGGRVDVGQGGVVSAGTLDLGGNTLTFGTNFATSGTGVLRMQDPLDSLIVAGDVLMDGGSTSGQLTNGVLRVAGNFAQAATTSPQSFLSTGTDVLFDGVAVQSISIADGASRLAGMTVAKSGGTVDISTSVQVNDSLVVTSPTTLQGAGGLLVNRKVVTAAGSTLAMGNLSLNPDSLQVGGGYAVGQTNFGAGTTIPALPYRSLVVHGGDLTFAGPATVDSALIIVNPGTRVTAPSGGSVGGRLLMINTSQLVLGPGTFAVADSFHIGFPAFPSNGGSTVVMQDPGTVLDVGGDVFIEGGNSTGLLTDGTLRVGGKFTTSTASSLFAFVPSGTHTTVFTNTSPVAVNLAANSRFRDLDLSQVGGALQLLSSVVVNGSLISTGSGGTFSGSGNETLIVQGGTNVTNLVLDNVPIALNGGNSHTFNNVTFQNFDPIKNQLTAFLAGPGGPFTFDGLNFTTTPTTGLYVLANDNNPGDGTPLDVRLTTANPASPGGFTSKANGALLTWNGVAQ